MTKRDVCAMSTRRVLMMISNCLRLLAEGPWGANDWRRHATTARRFAEMAVDCGLAGLTVARALVELRRAYDDALGEKS